MKRILLAFLIACLSISLFGGCANTSQEPSSAKESTVEDIANKTEDTTSESNENEVPERFIQKEKEVFFDGGTGSDSNPIDLSSLDSLMAYGALYEIVSSPTDHIGQEITLRGAYYAEYYSGPADYYHHVVVSDEQACCSLGIELVWEGEHLYPDDYPAYESTITVTGTFGYYLVNDQPVYCLQIKGDHPFV